MKERTEEYLTGKFCPWAQAAPSLAGEKNVQKQTEGSS